MWQTPFYRAYQFIMRLASYFLGIKSPETISGEGSLTKASDILQQNELSKPLIVTDNGIHSLGLLNPLFETLNTRNIEFAYFHDVVANPTIKNVEDGLKIYKENKCDSIIVVGGGSARQPVIIGAFIFAGACFVRRKCLNLSHSEPCTVPIPTTLSIISTAGTHKQHCFVRSIVSKDSFQLPVQMAMRGVKSITICQEIVITLSFFPSCVVTSKTAPDSK